MTAVRERLTYCLVVTNPAAGSVAAFTDEVAGRCAEEFPRVETRLTTGAGDAARIVAEAAAAEPDTRPDLIVVVGGDGTAREAAEGLARALGRWPSGGPGAGGPALLILPAGTGNSTFRALWGERDWEDVLAEVLRGEARVHQLDLARVVETDRAVLLGASTGLIAEVTAVASGLTDLDGRERYHHALGLVLADPKSYGGRVLADGEEIYSGPTTMVTVGGGRHRAGIFKVLPESILDDGLLDACVVAGGLDPETRAELAPLVMTGNHIGHPAVRYVQVRRITIERTDGEPLRVESDGDVLQDAGTTVTLEVVPAAVPVFAAPPASE